MPNINFCPAITCPFCNRKLPPLNTNLARKSLEVLSIKILKSETPELKKSFKVNNS